jgi:glycosyltransferase involved in cell wall biosynthesis
MKKVVNVVQVFESYPLFYQPYIPPVIDEIKKRGEIKLEINAYNGKASEGVSIIPKYYRRKFIELFYKLRNKTSVSLNYAEIKYINQKVDVVHLQHSYLFPKIKGLLELPKLERPKVIITLRGGDTYVKPWVSEKWRKFYKDDGGKVDAFITMSQHQKNYLHEKWGVNKSIIHVIPISFGDSKPMQLKEPNEKVLKVVSVFRMCWEKNIEGNLRVIQHLKTKGLPVQYDLYGGGPDAGQVMYLIDKYDLQDCVTYHGKVENKILKLQLPKSDFFLQLSHSESLGMSVIEAQSYGLPAIVSNSGGLPEVISQNKSGYCVESFNTEKAANVIEALWKNEKKYNSFSENAIKHANTNFSVDVEVNKLIELYHNILS